MRKFITIAALLISTPVYAQTMGSSSGASSIINMNMSDPPSSNTTTRLVTAPTIAAPGLAAAGIETCLGSASGGVSLMGGGFTFGSTTVDQGCTIRLLARQLFAFGFKNAAMAVMCEDARVSSAMNAVGTPCRHFFVEIGGPGEILDRVFAVPVSDQLSDVPVSLVRQNGVE